MQPIEIIAQAIGIVALVFNVLSYQQKSAKHVFLMQMVGSALFCINYFLLGATIGGVLNVVAVARAIVYYNSEKLKANHIVYFIFFTIAYISSYVITFTLLGKPFNLYNAVVELLPVVAMISLNIGFKIGTSKAIRRFGFIASPCWLAYNIINFAIGAIICEAISIISIFIGMLRHDIKKANK